MLIIEIDVFWTGSLYDDIVCGKVERGDIDGRLFRMFDMLKISNSLKPITTFWNVDYMCLEEVYVE
jgi:hypothetical protein